MALPKITSVLTDGNLERAEGSGNRSKHITIIGTAVDGPMYTSVTIRDLDHAESIFGTFNRGTLLRAMNEAWQAQMDSGRTPYISGVRVGGLVASRADLEIENNNSEVALKLEALYHGSRYNDIVITEDSSNDAIKIYNPVSGIWSTFKYNWTNSNAGGVDAHNVVELANAINADSNLNGILVASVPEMIATFEVFAKSGDAFVSSSNSKTTITLNGAGSGDLNADTLYLDGSSSTTTIDEVHRPIVRVSKVYAITDGGIEVLEGGSSQATTVHLPLAGRSDTRFDTLLNVIDENGTLGELAQTPDDLAITSEGYFKVRNQGIGILDLDVGSITFDAPLAIADADTSSNLSGTASAYTTAKNYGAGYTASNLGAEFQGLTRWTVAGEESSSGTYPIKVEWKDPSAGPNAWQAANLGDTAWALSWANDQATLTFPSSTPDRYDGMEIRISFDSCIGVFNEKSTLAGVEESSSSFLDYFVRGQEIIFGKALPHNLAVRYARVQYYELGSTISLEDAEAGKFSITGVGIQPGPGGGALGTSDSTIGFDVIYAQDEFSLSSSQSLLGGTSGTGLSDSTLYSELKEAYDNLDAFDFDLLITPGAYIDSTKGGYNVLTGAPEEVNAGFHELMDEFLSGYNGDARGIMGFKPIVGTGINNTISRKDVASRVSKLTVVDYSDNLRAANFLANFDSKYMMAIDLEPIVIAKGSRYTTTGEAIVAGHLAILEPEEAPYLSSLTGTQGLRYRYSSKVADGRSQLDALSDMRIIGARIDGYRARLVDGPSLAEPGSDYERWTTSSIVAAVMKDVRAVAEPFLGHVSNLPTLQALETTLRSRLNQRVPKSLSAYSFKIKSSPAQKVVGIIEIPLTLVPVFEIRQIKVTVVLKADASTLA